MLFYVHFPLDIFLLQAANIAAEGVACKVVSLQVIDVNSFIIIASINCAERSIFYFLLTNETGIQLTITQYNPLDVA